MRCSKSKTTISTNQCIQNQKQAKILPIWQIRFTSLTNCIDCEQGKAVKAHPETFINRDHKDLLKKYNTKPIKNTKCFRDADYFYQELTGE